MLRRVAVSLTRSIGARASQSRIVEANTFHSSTAVSSQNSGYSRVMRIGELAKYISSSDNRTHVPYQFRNQDSKLLLEAMLMVNTVCFSKLPYIANILSPSDIQGLKYNDAAKLILSILKNDKTLIEKYMRLATLDEKGAVLGFFIVHYEFDKHLDYNGFIKKMQSSQTLVGSCVLELLATIINSENLPNLSGCSNVKTLLCSGIYEGHIKNLPHSTLLDLFLFSVENNNLRYASKLSTMIDFAKLENPSYVIMRCLECNFDDLACKIVEKSESSDTLEMLIWIAVNWGGAAMMEDILRVFNPVRSKVYDALKEIITNSSSEEARFARSFISKDSQSSNSMDDFKGGAKLPDENPKPKVEVSVDVTRNNVNVGLGDNSRS